jgi:hypothetical protein
VAQLGLALGEEVHREVIRVLEQVVRPGVPAHAQREDRRVEREHHERRGGEAVDLRRLGE